MPDARTAPADPTHVLLDHNEWATRELLAACARLTDEQLDHEFEMSLGTLRKTIIHTLGAMRGWTDLLAKQDSRPRLEHDGPIPASEWPELAETVFRELREAALCGPMDETLTSSRDGTPYTFVRGQVITHITTHGMHHRAQCLNMLRHLGVEPLPKSAVVEWMFETR